MKWKLTNEEKEVLKEYLLIFRPIIYLWGLLREEGIKSTRKKNK